MGIRWRRWHSTVRDRHASKVAVGIVEAEDAEPYVLERWFSEDSDVRSNIGIAGEVSRFIVAHGAKSTVSRIASSVVLTRRAWTIPTEPPVPIVHSGLAGIAGRVSAFKKGPRYHYEVTAG